MNANIILVLVGLYHIASAQCLEHPDQPGMSLRHLRRVFRLQTLPVYCLVPDP